MQHWDRCAYVWLVMRGDVYIAGTLVAIHSVKQNGTKAKCVVMVTNDVSMEGRQKLAQLADQVVEVPYLEYKCLRMTTNFQQDRYGSWISQSFTKWRCLELKGYDKVIYLDSDIVALENLDPLFELRAPAATFSSPWAKPWKSNGMLNYYINYKHGKRVSKSDVMKGLKETFTLMGSCIVLKPCKEWFDALIKWLDRSVRLYKRGVGFPRCHSGQDEQSIAASLVDFGWTMIHQRYNSLFWHKEWLQGEKTAIWHYIGDKPWVMKSSAYIDLDGWWGYLEDLPKEWFDSKLLEQRDKLYDTCAFCGPTSKHRTVTKGRVTCPQLGGFTKEDEDLERSSAS